MPDEPNSESDHPIRSGRSSAAADGSRGDRPDEHLRGVEHPGVIDMIGFDAKREEVLLRMVERRPWDGSMERLVQLQEKFNAYLAFVLDGEMNEAYPKLAGRRVRIELECGAEPDLRTADLLEKVRQQIAFQGLRLDVRVVK